MKQAIKTFFLSMFIITSTQIPSTAGPFGLGDKSNKPTKPVQSTQKFSREEFMIMNLNRGQDSAGAHISESLKQTRLMIKDLDKSLRQLEQADREFSKSKGKPDDRYLNPATERLKEALKTAQELEKQIENSRNELKDSIHQALIMSQSQ